MKKKGVFEEIFIISILIFVISHFVWSCGGGGDGSRNDPSPESLSPATLDQASAEKAMALAMNGEGDINDVSEFRIDELLLKRSVFPSYQGWILKQVRAAFAAGKVVDYETRNGAMDQSGSCAISGSYHTSGSWNGPSETQDICEVSDAMLTMHYDNCRNYNKKIDGDMIVHIGGSLCLPTSMAITYTDITLDDYSTGIHIESENIEAEMSDLQWTADAKALTHMTSTLNGHMVIDAYDVEFYEYVEDIAVNGNAQTITINGSVTGACLDGWVTLSTLDPIVTDETSGCPVGGGLQLSGTDDVFVLFNDDGSMDIGDVHYASCEELPQECL